MAKLHILNTREVKDINKILKRQWRCRLPKRHVYLKNNKKKLYMVNRDISELDEKNLRVDSLGLYIATVKKDFVRLSIEGSQILGPEAKKNVYEMDEEETEQWMSGYDLDIDENLRGPYIIKKDNFYLGCGVAKNKKILNYVPKERRIG